MYTNPASHPASRKGEFHDRVQRHGSGQGHPPKHKCLSNCVSLHIYRSSYLFRSWARPQTDAPPQGLYGQSKNFES